MNYKEQIIVDIELHSVEGIRECFAHGVTPNDLYNNKPLIYELIGEYTRTPRFRDCVKVFADNGLRFEDQALLLVLLDDAATLEDFLKSDPSITAKRYSLRCAYTQMTEVTLLHICAEFNHVKSAEVLVRSGADINAPAGVDEFGFGGQTPVFHTVNQNSNQSFEMLKFLLSKQVDLQHAVRGLIWGKGYSWETFIPSVNPLSYAMMGLLPQMHRNERDIARVVSLLVKSAYGIDYEPTNVPCRYLHS